MVDIWLLFFFLNEKVIYFLFFLNFHFLVHSLDFQRAALKTSDIILLFTTSEAKQHFSRSPHGCWLFISTLWNDERKSQVKRHSDERGRNSKIRGGKYWQREKMQCRPGEGGEECDKGRKTELRETKRENVQSRGGMYLSALCRSSSGHLLPYIKGFALISMPLHPSTGWGGGCLCVHPYKL